MEESTLVSKNVKEVVDGLLSGTHAAPQDRETLLQLLFQVSRFAKDLQGELDSCRQSHSPSSGASAVSPRSSDLDPAEEFGTVIDIRNLPERVQRITADAANHRYFGKNSSMMMVQTAIETKGKHTNTLAPRLTRPQFWASHPVGLVELILQPQILTVSVGGRFGGTGRSTLPSSRSPLSSC